MAPVIVAELLELAPVIDKLLRAGVNMTQPGAATAVGTDAVATEAEPDPAALPLTGLTVVVTGAMSGVLAEHSRTEMNELIARAGGKASSSVSARTNLVVAGQNAGSKLDKARTLGTEVIHRQRSRQRVDFRQAL